MDFAIIKKPNGAIDPEDWQRIIAAHVALASVSDREMTNPFTNERVVASGFGKAYYIEGGKIVGNLALENGEIVATHVPRDACAELAILLAAEVHEADFS